jgi:hypothetical protein
MSTHVPIVIVLSGYGGLMTDTTITPHNTHGGHDHDRLRHDSDTQERGTDSRDGGGGGDESGGGMQWQPYVRFGAMILRPAGPATPTEAGAGP